MTHTDFLRRFKQERANYPKLENIEILGTYKNTRTKILVRCLVDGHEWEVLPTSLLRGRGCPKCSETRKTHSQFLEDLEKVNKDVEVLGTYKNTRTKILVRCKKDGHEWEVKPNDLLSGHGCPKCGGYLAKTHSQFLEDLEKVNKDVEVLGEYVNNATKILVRCLVDGHKWEVIPSSLLSGYGCPKCGGYLVKTHSQFLEDLEKINKDVEVLGTYKNDRTKILVRCKKDGHKWEVIPNSLIRGCGCPKCKYTSQTTSYAVFIHNFNHEYPRLAKNYEIIESTYVNTKNPAIVRHTTCGHTYKLKRVGDLLRGGGLCPKCYSNLSYGATEVLDYLNSLGLPTEQEKTFEGLTGLGDRPLRCDFLSNLDTKTLATEFHGEHHYDITMHKDSYKFEVRQHHDSLKSDYYLKSGFYYLEVPHTVDKNCYQDFTEFYVKKAQETRVRNLVPPVIINFMTRHLTYHLGEVRNEIPYGDWCLWDGDMLWLTPEDLSLNTKIRVMTRQGELRDLIMKEYICWKSPEIKLGEE